MYNHFQAYLKIKFFFFFFFEKKKNLIQYIIIYLPYEDNNINNKIKIIFLENVMLIFNNFEL